MNCSSNSDMISHFHTEEDALVIENAVKTAVSFVLDAIYTVNNDKFIEYHRTVTERNLEISRLKHKLKQTENELLKALIQQRGQCSSMSGNLDTSNGLNTTMHRNDVTPSTENETANEQHRYRELSSLGTKTPPLVPSQCQDGAATAPSPSNQVDHKQQMCMSHSSASTTDLPSPSSPFASPEPKKEPSSDAEAVFIKWEMCEQSLGGCKEGDGQCGQKSLGTKTPPLVPWQCQDGAATAPSNQVDHEQQMCTSHSSVSTTDLLSPSSPFASPEPKEEPSSDVEAVFIKWEMSEQSLGGCKEGDGQCGQKRTLTNAEKQKIYRERCRATPEGLRVYKERQRLRYLKSRTLVSEMPEEMRSLKRAYWRAAARRSRVRKTVQTELVQLYPLAQEEDSTQSHHLLHNTEMIEAPAIRGRGRPHMNRGGGRVQS